MSKENEGDNPDEQKDPKNVVNRVHITHFPVDKVKLREDGFDSGYEWVHAGNSKWIRVRKKPEVSDEPDLSG
jgi:hypothetical protein